MNAGIRLDEGQARLVGPLRTAPAGEVRKLAAVLDPQLEPGLAWYFATLTQGWKRQLRRMFGAVDAPIARLVRVRVGPVRLGELRSGRARLLKAPEVRALAGPLRAPGGDRTPGSVAPPRAAERARRRRPGSRHRET